MKRLRGSASWLAPFVLAAAACDRAELVDSDPVLPAMVTVNYEIAASGPLEAFQKSNRLLLRFRDDRSVRHESEVHFDGVAGTARVPVVLTLRRPAEEMVFELEVRLDANAVFRGRDTVQLRAGKTTPVTVILEPVIAAVRMTDPIATLTAWRDTLLLEAAAVFATGDTLPNVPIEWASLDTAVASVDPNGVLVSRSDGQARITARAGQIGDTAIVRVLATPQSIHVSPPGAAIQIGTTLQYLATVVDRRGNSLGRTVSWASSDTSILQIDTRGVVIGVAVGNAIIRATLDGLQGQVQARGVPGAPTIDTIGAVITGPGTARLDARIRPNGDMTGAWFEWSIASGGVPAPSLTLRQSLGSGLTAIPLTAGLLNLRPNTRYVARVVAVNSVGSAVSDTVSFVTPASSPSVVTTGYTSVSSTQVSLHGTVNPNNAETQVWFQWGTNPDLSSADSTPKLTLNGITTLQHSATVPIPAGKTLFFRIVARSATGSSAGAILSVPFGVPTPPTATTTAASDVAQTGARLNGVVNSGNASTVVRFHWGTDPALTTFSSTPTQTLPASGTGVPVTFVVQNLDPNAPYYYRVVATNAHGTSTGAILSFVTLPDPTASPPSVTTEAPGLLDIAVRMNGNANANGSVTRAWFEWSVDPNFGSFAATMPQALAASNATVAFHANVIGIPVGVTHYYRAVASNAGGKVYGAVMMFQR